MEALLAARAQLSKARGAFLSALDVPDATGADWQRAIEELAGSGMLTGLPTPQTKEARAAFLDAAVAQADRFVQHELAKVLRIAETFAPPTVWARLLLHATQTNGVVATSWPKVLSKDAAEVLLHGAEWHRSVVWKGHAQGGEWPAHLQGPAARALLLADVALALARAEKHAPDPRPSSSKRDNLEHTRFVAVVWAAGRAQLLEAVPLLQPFVARWSKRRPLLATVVRALAELGAPLDEAAVMEAARVDLEREPILAALRRHRRYAKLLPKVDDPLEGAEVAFAHYLELEAPNAKHAFIARVKLPKHGELFVYRWADEDEPWKLGVTGALTTIFDLPYEARMPQKKLAAVINEALSA